MARKPNKGKGSEFFLPRSAGSRSSIEARKSECVSLQGEEFTKGENAILAALEKLTDRMAKVEGAVKSLEVTLEGLDSRVKSVEAKADTLEIHLATVDTQLSSLQEAQGDYKEFKSKAVQAFMMMDTFKEQLDNERRGATVRILGLGSTRPDGDLAAEIGDFLATKINPHGDNTPVVLERVYRLPLKKNAEKGGIGTIMATLKNRSERDKVLAAANKNLIIDGRRILIFPDVSPSTMVRRKELLDLRKQFLARGAQASLWAPARLRVRHSNKQYDFNDPAAAAKFLESLPIASE